MIIYSPAGLVIKPYSKGDCTHLERMTSIYDNVYHRGVEITGFYDKDNDEFCTHWFDKKYIQYLMPYETIMDMGVQSGYPMENLKLTDDIQLTELQTKTIEKVLRSKKNRVFISLPTGEGKTLLSIYYILSSLAKNTLILCFSVRVLEQWFDTFRTKTTLSTDKIIIINSSKTILKIIEKNGSPHNIYMCTPGLLVKFAGKYGWDMLVKFITCTGIGVEIFDEAHRNIGALVKLDAHLPIMKHIYLSADPNASRKKRDLYYKIFANCDLIKLDKEELETTKFINAAIVEYNSNPSTMDNLSIYNRYGFSNDKFMEYEMNKGILSYAVAEILKGISMKNDSDHTILILMNMIKHVDSVHEWLTHEFPEWKVAKYHSRISSNEKEYALSNGDVIVTTHKSLGTGFDTGNARKIRYVLCLDVVDEIEDDQSAGRMRRDGDLTSYYFIFTDTGFDYCRSRIRSKLRYLSAQKFKKVFKIKVQEPEN